MTMIEFGSAPAKICPSAESKFVLPADVFLIDVGVVTTVNDAADDADSCAADDEDDPLAGIAWG